MFAKIVISRVTATCTSTLPILRQSVTKDKLVTPFAIDLIRYIQTQLIPYGTRALSHCIYNKTNCQTEKFHK